MAKKQKNNEISEWQVLVDAAKRGLQDQGYAITRLPGRGLSNLWTVTRNGKTQTASIRTTRNRWIAFPPLEGGTKWKTLDDVDLVVVAAVDNQDDPENVEVYLFQADEVRKRFDAAYKARIKNDQTIRDDFGMWIALDTDTRALATSVGSGLAQTSKPIATYALKSLAEQRNATPAKPDASYSARADTAPQELSGIADVMAWARQRVAEIAGVRPEAVKLDLKIEY